MTARPDLPPLGVHVSVAGGLPTAVGRAEELGCTAIQVFVKNASRWQARPLAPEDAEEFRQRRAASGIGPAVAHASYLINLAATDETVHRRSLAALADELGRCADAGLDALVVHPGAHLGRGEDAGIETVAASIDAVLAATPDAGVALLLENTAGQGSCLGWRLEHLAAIRARLAAPERVGVCIDTCHAFAAGYPVHEPAGYEEFVAELAEVVGLDAVGCLHLNDSVRPFGSRRDRHAHLGEGEIGTGCFARLVHDPRLRHLPMVVETEPGEGSEGHRRDLELLRAL